MGNKNIYNTYNIDTINGVVGDIEKINNFSIDKDINNISKTNDNSKLNLFISKCLNFYKKITTKKIFISLDKNNEITNIEEFQSKINKAIHYSLNNEPFMICLKPTRYLEEYHKAKNIGFKNQLNESLIENNLLIQKCENILNKSINLFKEYQLHERELIFRGIIEYYSVKKSNSPNNKISFENKKLNFTCYTCINDTDMKELDNKVSFQHVYFDTGYDIYDLPYNARFKEAIPTILFKIHERNIDFININEYFYQRIAIR